MIRFYTRGFNQLEKVYYIILHRIYSRKSTRTFFALYTILYICRYNVRDYMNDIPTLWSCSFK